MKVEIEQLRDAVIELNTRINDMIDKNDIIMTKAQEIAEHNKLLADALIAITKAKGFGHCKMIAQNALRGVRID